MDLNPHRHGTRRLLADPQSLHAAVLAAFPPRHDDGRVLWRTDRDEHRLSLYIVSARQPSFDHLQDQAGWTNEPSWTVRDYDVLLNRLRRGQRYGFRLTANPVHTVTHNGVKKRLAHVSVRHQTRWLLDRAEAMGVRFPGIDGTESAAVTLTDRQTLRFRRNGNQVTLGTARFDGLLEVEDIAATRRSLIDGVGRAKGYGCGLLTLAPTFAAHGG